MICVCVLLAILFPSLTHPLFASSMTGSVLVYEKNMNERIFGLHIPIKANKKKPYIHGFYFYKGEMDSSLVRILFLTLTSGGTLATGTSEQGVAVTIDDASNQKQCN
ncbi:hypothetical protein D3C74_367940 [compost metagenome]